MERQHLAMLYLHALSDPLVALEEMDLQDTPAECKITSVQISLAQQPCLRLSTTGNSRVSEKEGSG